jgi:sarcosine oxidase
MADVNYSGHYDAIVVGAGAMGSAAAYNLARRGKRVLVLERFGIPHDMGSYHGQTRIIRLAYYEDPSYVQLMRRAYELWHDIQNRVGERLLYKTGSIDAGPEDSWVFKGSWNSCRMHDLSHEVLTGAELHRRYPGYHLPKDHLALLQPDGGFLTPERCIVSYVTAAQAEGAEVHGHEGALDWEPLESGVRVRTERGSYDAEKLVVTAGAWNSNLLGVLDGLAVPERQVLAWLQPTAPERFQPGNFPVFNLLAEEGRFYGFPVYGVPGFKFGKYHHLEEDVDPDQMEREARAEDEDLLRQFAERYFPEGCGPTMSLHSCMFTNTPDKHFIIDTHPAYPQVSFASPCSGHGFKFASVVGEIMADLAETGMTRHDISLFRLDRFRPASGAGNPGEHRRVPASRPQARTVSGAENGSNGSNGPVNASHNGAPKNPQKNGRLRAFPQRDEVRTFW